MQAIKEREKKKVPVIEVDEQELRSHVSEVVRQSVDEVGRQIRTPNYTALAGTSF